MAYNAPLRTTPEANVSRHAQADKISPDAYIVTFAEHKTGVLAMSPPDAGADVKDMGVRAEADADGFQIADSQWLAGSIPVPDQNSSLRELLTTADRKTLRGLFKTVANPMQQDEARPFIVMHEGTQNTNSKITSFHAHVVTGELHENAKHIAWDKTFVPHPNGDFNNIAREKIGDAKQQSLVRISRAEGGEAECHQILACPGYSDMHDFMDRSSHQEFEQWRGNVVKMIDQNPPGGVRLIVDERFSGMPCFVVQALGGENLAQGLKDGKPARWFEAPDLAV